MKNLTLATGLLRPVLALGLALVAGLPAQAQSRYTVSANGQEVSDAQTGLTWRRCAEGMAWSGSTCSGSASTFTHEAALAHARDQAGWRLPNVKELQTLVDKSRTNPSIDPSAFPGAPSSIFWTSTPSAERPSSAWCVGFYTGNVYPNFRSIGNAVRLVRASQ